MERYLRNSVSGGSGSNHSPGRCVFKGKHQIGRAELLLLTPKQPIASVLFDIALFELERCQFGDLSMGRRLKRIFSKIPFPMSSTVRSAFSALRRHLRQRKMVVAQVLVSHRHIAARPPQVLDESGAAGSKE